MADALLANAGLSPKEPWQRQLPSENLDVESEGGSTVTSEVARNAPPVTVQSRADVDRTLVENL